MPLPDEEAIDTAREESETKCFWAYKSDEFRERFVSPFEQYRDRIGQKFDVIKTYTLAETAAMCGVGEEEAQPMYDIRFEDGTKITAWGEEVCVPNQQEGRWVDRKEKGVEGIGR